VGLSVLVQIDEKVKEAIMKDLVKYAPGIEIIGVRVTKPKIPRLSRATTSRWRRRGQRYCTHPAHYLPPTIWRFTHSCT